MDKGAMVLQLVNEFTNGNKAQFANILGVSAQTINAWISRKTFDAELIYTKCVDVSANWLLTGQGQMISGTHNSSRILKADNQDSGIPLLTVDAMAGFFAGEQTVMLSECERYIVPSFHNADFLITVRGDSMTPRYFSGDMVACKMLSLQDIFFQWGKVYVVDTDQGALIKKVEEGSTPDTIQLVSENSNYKPFEIPRTSIYHIALVLGIIRTE